MPNKVTLSVRIESDVVEKVKIIRARLNDEYPTMQITMSVAVRMLLLEGIGVIDHRLATGSRRPTIPTPRSRPK